MNLHEYDLIIVNSSGGKDSACAIYEVCRLADLQGFSKENIAVSHQDLGRFEWRGVRELAQRQAEFFGLPIYFSKRRNKEGVEETLLDYVRRRGKWPSRDQRYCTSDFKRGPGARVVTELTKDKVLCKVLYVFGFRKDESPARAKKVSLLLNKKLTTKTRVVHEWLPILDWDTKRIWDTIKFEKIPFHKAYELGMPRLSCCFCIFSPFDALIIAGKENPELLQEYVDCEREIQHTFRQDFAIESVQVAISAGYEPKKIKDWIM